MYLNLLKIDHHYKKKGGEKWLYDEHKRELINWFRNHVSVTNKKSCMYPPIYIQCFKTFL